MIESNALRGQPAEPPRGRLRVRTPATSVIAEFLRAQDAVAVRSRLARICGRSPLSEESRSLFWGAVGELEVGNALDQLGEDWTVLHSVPIGRDGADIDHVVLGPGGVFTINTRNHTGQGVWVSGREFRVAGHRLPYVRNAEYELGRAETLLSEATGLAVKATAILAIVDPAALTVREKPRDVVVLTSTQLSRWLARRRPVLAPHQVATLSQAAEQEETWKQHPAIIGDTAEQLRKFESLRGEVSAARLVRQLWILGLTLALFGAIVGLGFIHFATIAG